MARLTSVSKSVAEELKVATPDRQRAAVLAACDFAASSVGNDLPSAMGQLYAQLKTGALSAADLELLERARDAHDDRYLQLQDRDDPQHIKEFSLARFLSAMRFAAEPTSFASTADAIYEASCVDDDRVKFIQTVRAALQR